MLTASHWSSLGAVNALDSAIMTYAHQNDYVVLTHDLDFGAILAATQGEKPSVVQIRTYDVSPSMIGKHLRCSRSIKNYKAVVTVCGSAMRCKYSGTVALIIGFAVSTIE